MMTWILDKRTESRVRAGLGKIIPTIHVHDPLRIPNSVRHPPLTVVHTTEDWELPDTLDTSHHPTPTEPTENWDDGV